MKIAVLGPVCKDYTKIDDDLQIQMGGIPYYVALTLKNLGVDVVPFITYGKEDESWVHDNFKGIQFKSLFVDKTLESHLEYSSETPDVRKHKIQYYPNIVEATVDLVCELGKYDFIILAPLFNDNIPSELFFKLKDKNLVYGNFGMFTYDDDGKFVRRNPEKLINVLPCLEYMFLDNNEAIFVSGKETINEAAEYFLSKGLKNCIITEGSRGSHVFVGDKYYYIQAFMPTKVVDPTGAGDTYLAAYIRATELFSDPREQGKFAAMVATISLEKRGAFDLSINDVKNRLIKYNK